MFRVASGSVPPKVLLALLTVLIAGVLAPSASAVPYHTPPTPNHVEGRYGSCLFWFDNPRSVYGYAYEYVYWRPYSAELIGNQWRYSNEEWRRAITTTTGMTTGWYSQQWPYYDWLPANGSAVVAVTPGPNRWIGYQVYYGSNGYTYTNWLYSGSANC
jgi:hypothetical protein